MKGTGITRGRRRPGAGAALGAFEKNELGMRDIHSANLGEDILLFDKEKKYFTGIVGRRSHGGL